MMITVSVHDGRGGHDGMANGGHFGGFSKLIVKPRGGDIAAAVFVVSDEDNGHYQSGNRVNQHSTDRTTVFAVDPRQVEWACVLEGYDAQPAMHGSCGSSRQSWRAIEGLPAGPLVELQIFLQAHKDWTETNFEPAGRWLLETAERAGAKELAEAAAYALRKCSKSMISSAWGGVARLAGVVLEPKGSSWTAVRSLPIRIATAVQRLRKEEWKLYGPQAYRFQGDRPQHPGEAKGYFTLPSKSVTLGQQPKERAS